MKRILTAIVLITAVVALVFSAPSGPSRSSPPSSPASPHTSTATSPTSPPPTSPSGGSSPPSPPSSSSTLPGRNPDLTLPVISLLTFILFTVSGFTAPLERVLRDTALGLFALLYAVYPLTLLPLIKAHEDGTGLLLFLFVCVWAGDIFALYIGKNFGRRKLAPRLSPNKTWEGSIASVLGSVLCGMGLYYLGDHLAATRNFSALHISTPVWQMALLAIVLNIAAQLGDLLESAIKRGADVKGLRHPPPRPRRHPGPHRRPPPSRPRPLVRPPSQRLPILHPPNRCRAHCNRHIIRV